MFEPLARFLAFFYELWPSYAGAIVLFTLAIMLVLSPLAIKSTRSMIRMQRLNPELKKLQAKHKGDREALNQEMMAFYKANNVNPLASCLPMLLQFPVLIALYQVLRGLTRTTDGVFDPEYLDRSTSLYRDLAGEREMLSFGMDLSKSALEELQNDGLLVAIPFLLLVGLVAVTTFVQQRQVAGRNPNAAANPQQQMLTKVLPFIIVPFSFSFPAGLVVYFATSNLVRVAQQGLVSRLEAGHEIKPVVSPESTAGDDGPPKPAKPKPATGGKAPKPSTGNGSGGGSRSNGSGRTTPPGNGARSGGARGSASASSASRSRNRKRKRK